MLLLFTNDAAEINNSEFSLVTLPILRLVFPTSPVLQTPPIPHSDGKNKHNEKGNTEIATEWENGEGFILEEGKEDDDLLRRACCR